MCGNFTATAVPQTETRTPRFVDRNARRFYNGAWQRPSEKLRGWRDSVGLAGLTYEQGVAKLERLNSGREDGFLRSLVNVTTEDQMPRFVDRNARRFYNGEWQRPSEKLRGWRASVGLAGLTYEQGVAKLERLNSGAEDGYSRNLVNITTEDQMPVVEQASPVVFPDNDKPTAEVYTGPITQQDVEGFEEYAMEPVPEILATVPSELGASFNPSVTFLPNGGLALVLDSSTAITMLRAVGTVVGRDAGLAGRLMQATENAAPELLNAAMVTVLQTPVRFGFGAERA